MTLPSSTIIIVIVVAFAFYLIYSQSSQPKYIQMPPQYVQASYPALTKYEQMDHVDSRSYQMGSGQMGSPQMGSPQMGSPQMGPGQMGSPQMGPGQMGRPAPQQPQITNVVIDKDVDPFSDAIKKQDLYTMYDPLTYPQLRLPREVLERYNEYYERSGTYPPFNYATQPFLFDNPILNGVLIKIIDENEPFSDNVPSAVPIFRVKSVKNANRYFYYVIDQRYLSRIEPKIPLDHVKVNGVRYNNADFYGIPELFDGDCIEGIPIYPGTRFKVTLYKSYHFP